MNILFGMLVLFLIGQPLALALEPSGEMSLSGTRAGSPAQDDPSLYWNIWVTKQDGFLEPLRFLNPNQEYLLVIDLSVANYNEWDKRIFIQIPSPDFAQRLGSTPQEGHKKTEEFTARFLGIPGQVKSADEKKKVFSVDMAKTHLGKSALDSSGSFPQIVQSQEAPFILGRVSLPIRTGEKEGMVWGNELVLQMEGETITRIRFPLCVATETRASTLCEESKPFVENESEETNGEKGAEESSNVSAYWNSWVQHRHAPHADPLPTALEANRNYSFVLDLSPYPYQQTGVGTATPSPEFMEELKNTNRLVVYVRPVLGGRGLKALPGEFALRRWEIANLAALRQPGPERQPNEAFQDFAQRVRAGQFRIGVQSTAEGGCAVIGLSIWNESQDRPLDHLVHTVAVADASGKLPESCEGQGLDGNRLRAGLLALMTVKPDPPATAGIHIFKLQKASSAVIYVERPPEGTPAKSFAWTFPDDVGAYLQNPLFVQAFKEGRGEGYGNAANLLSNVVFDGDTAHDQVQATLAQQALAQLQAKGAPVSLFVRLVDEDGTNRFLPLGLLKTGTSLLGEQATLLYPLPRESYGPSTNCIANWTLAIPDKLDKAETLGGRYAKYVQTLEQEGQARLKNIEELKCYLQGGVLQDGQCQSHTTSPRSEGLILLAHHAKGDVWFDNSLQPLRYNRIKRRFPPGSVAILSACSTAELDSKAPRQMPFVSRLNEKGIDAAILSPFEVPLPLGLAFVQGFHATLQQAYTTMAAQPHQPGPTIQELFTDTIHAMQKSPTKIFAADPNVEFLLAGNAGLRLCPLKEDHQ